MRTVLTALCAGLIAFNAHLVVKMKDGSPLFRGIQATDDRRDDLVLAIGDGSVEVDMEYQCVWMSVGLLDGQPGRPAALLVLVASMRDAHIARVPPFVAEVKPLGFLAGTAAGRSEGEG